MTRKVNLRIWRGDSKKGEFKDVTVDANEGEVLAFAIASERLAHGRERVPLDTPFGGGPIRPQLPLEKAMR